MGNKRKNYGKQGKGKGNKNYQKNSSKTEVKETKQYDAIKSNDINWWNQSVMYNDAVRIPFNRITGDKLDLHKISPTGSSGTGGVSGDTKSLPVAMRINYYPGIGAANSITDPVNRCFTSIYAGIYAKTTGAMQFTQANLAFNTLAVDSVLTNVALIKRALGLSTLYSGMNYAYPRVIIAASGFDPDTIIGRQDDIRRRLNDVIYNMNALRLPGWMDLFKRHYQLAHNVYADEDDIRAQMYVFMPQGYYIHRDGPDRPDYPFEHIEYINFEWDSWMSLPVLNVNDVLDILDQQLEAIRHSSAFGLVSGSLQRAFPDAELLSVETVPVDYTIIPSCDRNMNWQIQNLIAVGEINASDLVVSEDTLKDRVIYDPKKYVEKIDQYDEFNFDSGFVGLSPSYLLNSYDGNTSDEFIMEATRLQSFCTTNFDSEDGWTIHFECGTELIKSFGVISMNYNDSGLLNCQYPEFTTIINFNDIAPSFVGMDELMSLEKFRHAPRVQLFVDGTFSYPSGDLYCWTTVDQEALKGLHKAALQSIYRTDKLNTIH